MLFHGEFLRVFVFPLGLSPFGMCILPSGAEDSKRLKYTIFRLEYQAECTSLCILLHEFHNGVVKELRVICQRFPSGILVHPDLVFHHILGILQRKSILIAVIHVVVDFHDDIHHPLFHVLLLLAHPRRHICPCVGRCRFIRTFCHPWHKPLCGAVSGAAGLSAHPSQQVGFLHCFLDAPDRNLDKVLAVIVAGFEVAPAVYRCHQALGDLQQGSFFFLGDVLLHGGFLRFSWFSVSVCAYYRLCHTLSSGYTTQICSPGTVRITAEEKGRRFRQAPCVSLA
nr:MAG TPA_asm: hypothetical protein [Caudoviricetes sp.]